MTGEDAGTVTVLAGEDAWTVTISELGSVKKVVVTESLEFVMAADVEDISGGNPKIEPLV